MIERAVARRTILGCPLIFKPTASEFTRIWNLLIWPEWATRIASAQFQFTQVGAPDFGIIQQFRSGSG